MCPYFLTLHIIRAAKFLTYCSQDSGIVKISSFCLSAKSFAKIKWTNEQMIKTTKHSALSVLLRLMETEALMWTQGLRCSLLRLKETHKEITQLSSFQWCTVRINHQHRDQHPHHRTKEGRTSQMLVNMRVFCPQKKRFLKISDRF